MNHQVRIRNGKLGELLVEVELVKRYWHVERLDGSTRAINGDLVAIKGRARIVIQVKSALSANRPSFGYATPYLTKQKSFFNKDNPTVSADILVTVCISSSTPVFHVFKICDAEKLARSAAEKWYEQRTRLNCQRSENFPVSFSLNDRRISSALNDWSVLDKFGV